MRAGCSPTGRSNAGAATITDRHHRQRAPSQPSRSATVIRVRFALAATSNVGVTTSTDRRRRRQAPSRQSRPGPYIRAGCSPTGRSNAGVTTDGRQGHSSMMSTRRLPIRAKTHHVRRPHRASLRSASWGERHHLRAPSLQSQPGAFTAAGFAPTGKSHAGASTNMDKHHRPRARSSPSPPRSGIRAGCASAARSSAGATTTSDRHHRQQAPSPPHSTSCACCKQRSGAPAEAVTATCRADEEE